ncbi:MAG: DNA polymerase I, partial [Spirochaetales bacterium]
QYGSLEGIYENIDSVTGSIGQKLRNGKETAFFSRSLIALRSDVPIEKDIDSFRTLPDYKAAAKLLKQHGVPTIAKLFESASDNTASSDKTAEATLSPTPVHKVSFEEPCFYEYSQNTGDYCLIQTLEELTGIIDCAEKQAYVAFDCETDSLNTHNTNLVGFSLCLDPGKAYYIPIKTRDMLFVGQTVSKEDALRQLERIFFNRDMTLIMHNGKFDLEVLCSNGLGKSHNKGFPTCTVYDTIIAAWLLQPERESFKLENLAERILGLQGIDFASIVSKGMTFEDVPLDTAVSYAGEDADFTLQLWNVFKPLLKQAELETLFYTLEMPVLPILAQMEMNGIKIEKHKLAEYANELEVEIAESEQSIYDAVGHEFNIASTKQLQTVLFTELQLPATKKTKTGYSTDTTVLQELAAYNPVPKKILEYRAMTKLKSTYVDALPLLADARGRIHTSFVQTGTATGRLSSRDPNLQNIPVRDKAGRRIRSAFIAPEGKMLVSADYSQIELVILAHLSNDKNLCKAFIEGIDVHRATAALIFGIDSDDVSAEQRRTAKTINFGVMYGMSSFRLANELGISRATAQEFIDSYFATYVDVQRFMHETIVKAEQTGYVETIMGRRRYIPGIAGKNKNEKAAAERIAINTPIQGSAADIVKKAMLAVHTSLQTHVPSAKLLLQVHDELIAECEEKDADKVAEIFRKEMEAAVELSIPLRVNAEIGKSWGDFH